MRTLLLLGLNLLAEHICCVLSCVVGRDGSDIKLHSEFVPV